MATILIVDDQKSVLLTLESILQAKGHIILQATNTHDALDQLAAQHVDLVITDAVMPGGPSGFEFIVTVRKKEQWADLPVVLLTGKREKKDVERGIGVGANDYVVKPIDPEILMAKVDGLLSKKERSALGLFEVPVRYHATFRDRTEIRSVSEVGVEVWSELPAPVGAKLRIDSSFFGDLGLTEPLLRVIKCEPMAGELKMFKILLHFVGYSEKEFQILRLWIRKQQKSSA